MSFPTIEFAAFFVVVFVLSWALMPHPRAWRPFILAASYLFYGWIDWRWVLLLIASSVVNTVAAQVIARSPSAATRKRALIAAVAFDLGLLAVFKYLSFFVSETDSALDSIGLGSLDPAGPDRASDRDLVLHLPGDLATWWTCTGARRAPPRSWTWRSSRRSSRTSWPGRSCGRTSFSPSCARRAIRAPCWPARRSS